MLADVRLGSNSEVSRPRGTSALPSTADSSRTSRKVRFVPSRDSCSAAKTSLFDDLVGTDEQAWRNSDPECPRGFEIDDEFKLGGLLDG